LLSAAFVFALATVTAAQQTVPQPGQVLSEQRPDPAGQGALRTFSIEKPAAAIDQTHTSANSAMALRPPSAHDSLRTSVGLGYVQGADWGTEIIAAGGMAGTQVQFHTLLTKGREGLMLDQGGISVFDPDARWRAEAGDLFSHLRGASRGARLTWVSASGGRSPAIAVYGPARGADAATIVSYRDQLQFGGQTLLDAEVASDRSYVLRTRLGSSRFDVEGFYRSSRNPVPTQDASFSAGVTVLRGIGLNGGVSRSTQSGDRNEWRTIAVRLPVTRFFDLTLERAYAGTPGGSQSMSAAMGSLTAGQTRLFHRHQQGNYDFSSGAFGGSVERQQTQSVASYHAGSRLNVMLQLATQRTDSGRVQHWEEMQTTLRLTSTTTIRAVTAVPDIRDSERWRAHFSQQLPSGFAVQADYGRLSAFQSLPNGFDRSRFKLMVFKTLDLATPARGGEVSGRVADDAGRGVAGAGVKLGPYSTESDATGAYNFRHLPAGAYELSIDPHLLPADVAWDGRIERLEVTAKTKVKADLLVAPLNAVHGRVYCDRNGNGRYDAGEGVQGAVLQLGDDRFTATDQSGTYTFFNLWPATYVVRLIRQQLPETYTTADAELSATLGDNGPVTGADFQVAPKVKPVVWTEPSR
jgi:hypothetical protein